jgi:hypothetical protein
MLVMAVLHAQVPRDVCRVAETKGFGERDRQRTTSSSEEKKKLISQRRQVCRIICLITATAISN